MIETITLVGVGEQQVKRNSISFPSTLNLSIEFGGGMELLFSNQHEHSISIPKYYNPLNLNQQQLIVKQQQQNSLNSKNIITSDNNNNKPVDIKFLIWWLKEFLIADKERTELFSQGESIRPGILILINSTDWELEGELEYELKEGDELVFISTLHGG